MTAAVIALMLGTERATQLSQSALPHAPVVVEPSRARRRRRAPRRPIGAARPVQVTGR